MAKVAASPINGLGGTNIALIEENENLAREKKLVEQKNEELQDALNEMTDNMARISSTHENEVTMLSAALATARQSLDEQHKTSIALAQEADHGDNSLSLVSEAHGAAVDELTVRIRTLEQQCRSKDMVIIELKEKLSRGASLKSSEIEAEATQLRQEKHQLELKNEQLSQELDSITNEGPQHNKKMKETLDMIAELKARFNQERENLNRQLDGQGNDIEALLVEVDRRKKAEIRLERELVQISKTKTEVIAQLEAVKQEHSKSQEELVKLRTSAEVQSTANLLRVMNETEDLRVILGKSKQESADLKAHCDKLEGEKQAAQDTLVKLERTNYKQKEELFDLTQQSERRVSKLQESLLTCQENLRTSDRDLANCRRESSLKSDELAKIQANLETTCAQNEMLKAESTRHKTLAEEYIRLKHRESDLVSSAVNEEKRGIFSSLPLHLPYTMYPELIADRTVPIDVRLQAQVDQLKSELQRTTQKLLATGIELERSERENAQFNSRLASQKDEFDQLELNHNEQSLAQSKIESAQRSAIARATSFQQKCAAMENKAVELEATIRSMEEEAKQASDERRKLESTLRTLKDALHGEQTELRRLTVQMSEKDADTKLIEEKYRDLRAKFTVSEESVAHFEKLCKSRQAEKSELEEKLEERHKCYQSVLAHATLQDRQVATLQAELSAARESINKLERSLLLAEQQVVILEF
jgi:chromosome segregation ATPase